MKILKRIKNLFTSTSARTKRLRAMSRDYYFGRNFNITNNLTVVEKVIHENNMVNRVVVCRKAFKNNGNVATKKFAVYFISHEDETLFYQFYKNEKEKIKQRRKQIRREAKQKS